jgi:membrane associated rhomboid family serine protease
LSRKRLLALVALIGLVALLLVALAVGVYEDVRDDRDSLLSALVGALIGIVAVLLISWLSLQRSGSESLSTRKQSWLIALGAASATGWSLLAPTWEAAVLGFLSGFLLAWIAVVTAIAVSIRD